MKKILLVEDDASLGKSVKEALEKESYKVELTACLKEARALSLLNYNLILLDWMLPDGQGIDFLKELRSQNINIPIIMLTARADLIDKILGLEGGANDYLTKPFEIRELVARIRVQLRTHIGSTSIEDIKLQIGELVMDQSERSVSYKKEEIFLTKMEFDLLHLLASNPKKTYSREKLLDLVWGLENYPTTRTVDTHILQLRQKLDSDLIETIRGVGYRFAVS